MADNRRTRRPNTSALLQLVPSAITHAVMSLFRSERTRSFAERLLHRSAFDVWCKAQPCPVVEDRFRLYELLVELEQLDQPIDYLEFGVFKGATLSWWSERNKHPESRFVGFDSFEGLPEDWRAEYPKGAFDAGRRPPHIADARVSCEVGLFQVTLPAFLQTFERTRRTVVHVDADLFSSALFVLIQVIPRLRQGDIIVFDEFDSYLHEFRACQEFLLVYPCTIKALGATAGYRGRGYGRLAVKLVSVPSRAVGQPVSLTSWTPSSQRIVS